MSQTVLWLHHFHEYWSTGLANNNTDFNTEMSKVLDYIQNTNIDKIIITMFEEYRLQPEHEPLIKYCQNNAIDIESYEYNYAWYRDENSAETVYTEENYGSTWIQGTREYHEENDVLEIENWHHELKENNDKVILAGAFANECLDDANSVLKHLEIDYKEEKGLCVGYGVPYEFLGQTPEEIFDDLTQKIDNIEIEIQLFCSKNNIDLTNPEIDEFEEIVQISNDFIESISDKLNELFDDSEILDLLETNGYWLSSSYCFVEDLLDDIQSNAEKSSQLINKIDEWKNDNQVQLKNKKLKL